jgi:ABC-type nitrate/sulfonate/bicarbonate transport system permease component
MAATGVVTGARRGAVDPVLALRIAIILVVLALWQGVAMSGLLYRDVVPGLGAIAAALVRLAGSGDFYRNLGVTAGEAGLALAIGGIGGLAAGIVLAATGCSAGPSNATSTGSGRRRRSSFSRS